MVGKMAFVTGVTGQDGSYLVELLLDTGYEVHGLVRRTSTLTRERLDHVQTQKGQHSPDARFFYEYGDLSDGSSLRHLLFRIQPDEVYNLAAQSHVRISFDQAEYTADVTGTGVLRLLEALRDYVQSAGKPVRMYQASSSEMFGSSPPPQNEQTPFHPRSPYGVAKVSAYLYTVNYREAYGLHVTNGIMFNHESERRGENFVSRKITRAAGRIKMGLQNRLYMGNLDARRDWGYAKDYVEAMWIMLQQEKPDDYVIATGQSHSVREFLEEAFGYLGLDWRQFVEIAPYFYRPSEVADLQGDPSKATRALGWKPKVDFKSLVRIMVDHDLELAQREAHAEKFIKG